jgi:hypothetical protein
MFSEVTNTKDAYYFSHDSNAKDDPKCVMLIEQLGLEGYGIFWVLIETLRDQPQYRYPINLLPALARRFNTTHDKMKVVVNNYGLFKIENDEFFYSESLIQRMQHFEYKRELARIAGKKSGEARKLLNGGSTDVQQPLNECSTADEQVKQSIVEDSIENKKITIDEFYNLIWSIYPKKEGKGQVSAKQKKKLFEIGIEEMTRAVNRYIKAKQGVDKQFLQNGSTFFNSGYVDYLDKDYTEDKPQESNKHDDIIIAPDWFRQVNGG